MFAQQSKKRGYIEKIYIVYKSNCQVGEHYLILAGKIAYFGVPSKIKGRTKQVYSSFRLYKRILAMSSLQSFIKSSPRFFLKSSYNFYSNCRGNPPWKRILKTTFVGVRLIPGRYPIEVEIGGL